MKWSLFVCLFAILSPAASAVEFLSSSGQETYETNIILEPKSNAELKTLLQSAHDKEQRLALGGAGYKLKDEHHFQGVSFGAHAYGINGQPRLSTQFLQKKKLESGDFELDRENLFAFVRVKGGNTQGQVLAMANEALPPDLRDQYEFFLPGPSTQYITIGGAMAAHTHYRSTYPHAGFISDQVENFTLVAIKDGKATEIFCSRDANADLFHAIPGSFGRGGVITDVTLKLQLVPKNYRPTTTMRVYERLSDYQTAYAAGVEHLKHPSLVGKHNKAFLGINGFITDNYYYIFTFDLEPKDKSLTEFDIFKKPDGWTRLGHYGSHANWPGLHWLANFVTEYIVLGGNNTKYQNDLIPWLFFHNGFLDFRDSFDSIKENIAVQGPKAVLSEIVGPNRTETVFGRNMQTAHQGYVMKLADYARFMRDFEKLLSKRQFSGMNFKFRDFDPVPSSRTVMSPAYSENPDEVFVVATLSWPVNTAAEKVAIDALKKEITSLKYVRVHPHKEFDPESDLLRKSYAEQAQRFEQILKDNQIDDRVLWTKMHKALYGKGIRD